MPGQIRNNEEANVDSNISKAYAAEPGNDDIAILPNGVASWPQRWVKSHFSDSDSAPAPRFKTPATATAPTLKIFETSTPTPANTLKTSK